MKFVSHSDSPEIGARIVAKGFGLFLFLLFPKCPILLCGSHCLFFLWPQALDSQLSYLLSSSIIFQFFFFFPFFLDPLFLSISTASQRQEKGWKILKAVGNGSDIKRLLVHSTSASVSTLSISHLRSCLQEGTAVSQQGFLFMQAQSPR